MYHLIEKIPIPQAVNKQYFICIQNKEKQDMCYRTNSANYIECEQDKLESGQNDAYCRLNFRTTTFDPKKITLPKGIWVSMERSDNINAPIYYILGNFRKSELERVFAITGQTIEYKEANSSFPTLGYAPPPEKCKYAWNMLREDCRPYAESVDWKVGMSPKFPFLQWKQVEKAS